MGWIARGLIHRCQRPEFDFQDQHDVGDIWQCDDLKCHVYWRVVAINIQHTRSDGGSPTGSYLWTIYKPY